MRVTNKSYDPFVKDFKHRALTLMPDWFERIKNYPDIDKKRLGPCKTNNLERKKSP